MAEPPPRPKASALCVAMAIVQGAGRPPDTSPETAALGSLASVRDPATLDLCARICLFALSAAAAVALAASTVCSEEKESFLRFIRAFSTHGDAEDPELCLSLMALLFRVDIEVHVAAEESSSFGVRRRAGANAKRLLMKDLKLDSPKPKAQPAQSPIRRPPLQLELQQDGRFRLREDDQGLRSWISLPQLVCRSLKVIANTESALAQSTGEAKANWDAMSSLDSPTRWAEIRRLLIIRGFRQVDLSRDFGAPLPGDPPAVDRPSSPPMISAATPLAPAAEPRPGEFVGRTPLPRSEQAQRRRHTVKNASSSPPSRRRR